MLLMNTEMTTTTMMMTMDFKKWQARIQVGGKKIFLGLYNTQLEAHEAYLNKLKEVLNSVD